MQLLNISYLSIVVIFKIDAISFVQRKRKIVWYSKIVISESYHESIKCHIFQAMLRH